MIVAGLGSRKGVTEMEVLAGIDAALAASALTRDRLDRLATASLKRDEEGMRAAGEALGLELVVVDEVVLTAVSTRVLTRSALSVAKAGTPSVSEASALAVAGPGARLLGPRVVTGPVTCAIAAAEDEP